MAKGQQYSARLPSASWAWARVWWAERRCFRDLHPALAAKGIFLDSEQPVSSSTTDLPKLHGKDSAVNVGAHRFCESLEFLDYKLPPPGVSAGRVLQHAKSVLSTLIQKEQPLIFKVGYTHNPMFRWANTLYGYMLEAALIELFRSTLCNLLYWVLRMLWNNPG